MIKSVNSIVSALLSSCKRGALKWFTKFKLSILGKLFDECSDEFRMQAFAKLLETDRFATDKDLDQVANFSAYMRNQWVADKAASVSSDSKVLDAGAGQCQYKKLFAHTQYFSQDFAQYTGNNSGPLKETWDYHKLDYISDITDIPVDDGEFDVVVCTEVLEHVPSPVTAIEELVRVLAPSGKIFISAPLGSGIHQEPYHYYGGFSPYFYHRFLKEYGVKVDKVIPIGGHFKSVAQELLRAARTLDDKGVLGENEKVILEKWLPLKLHQLDDEHFLEQFTVGYLVEGTKHPSET